MLLQVIMQCLMLPGWLHFLQVALYFWSECDFYNITVNTHNTHNVNVNNVNADCMGHYIQHWTHHNRKMIYYSTLAEMTENVFCCSNKSCSNT